jgi:REP element-mobilizing transposase RayT
VEGATISYSIFVRSTKLFSCLFFVFQLPRFDGKQKRCQQQKRCQELFMDNMVRASYIDNTMERPKRAAAGGLMYHVLNRANARLSIFEKDEDYEAFERILADAIERTGTQLLANCRMPNHWNLVVLPIQEGELSRFTGWLTLTHTQRWHAHRRSTGQGHFYQGRFK